MMIVLLSLLIEQIEFIWMSKDKKLSWQDYGLWDLQFNRFNPKDTRLIVT